MTQAEKLSALIGDKLERTLLKSLGIAIVELAPDKVVATMPVDDRTRQPMGLLHGGASVALAETVASAGGLLNVDLSVQTIVGVEINANHLRSKKDGQVTAVATPIKIGSKIQVWDIKIQNEAGYLISVSRCTLAVVDV